MPWLTPSETPTGVSCRRFLIPDSVEFRSAFLGAIILLTRSENWEQTSGGMTPQDTANLFNQMFIEAWDNWEECSMGVFDVKIDNNKFYKKMSAGGDWEYVGEMDFFGVVAESLGEGAQATATFENGVITFGIPRGDKGDTGQDGQDGQDGQNAPIPVFAFEGYNLTVDADADGIVDATSGSLRGDTGAQGLKGDTGDTGAQGLKGDTGDTGAQGLKGDTGDTGAQGLKGDKGDKGDTGDSGITSTSTGNPLVAAGETYDAQNVCGGTRGLLLDFIIPRMIDMWNTYAAQVAGTATAAQTLIAVAEAATAGGAELAPIDEVANIMERFVENGITDALNELNSSVNQEAWWESLYCTVKDNALLFDQAIWDSWVAEQANGSSGFKSVLEDTWAFTEILNRYNVYALDKSTFCDGSEWCPDEPTLTCIEWDFLTAQHDWLTIGGSGFGNWTLGTGWTHGTVGQTRRVDIVSPVWSNDNAIHVTRIEVDCDFSSGSPNPNQYMSLGVVGGGSVVVLDNNTPDQGSGITVGMNCNVSSAISVRISFQTSDNSGGGSCTVRKVRVFFDEGDNPYPDLPCV